MDWSDPLNKKTKNFFYSPKNWNFKKNFFYSEIEISKFSVYSLKTEILTHFMKKSKIFPYFVKIDILDHYKRLFLYSFKTEILEQSTQKS